MTEYRAVIFDTKRQAFWRANAAGYTADIREAGLYSLQEIAERNAKLSCRYLVPFPSSARRPAAGPSSSSREAAAGPCNGNDGSSASGSPVIPGCTDATLPAAAASSRSTEGPDGRGLETERNPYDKTVRTHFS